MAIDQQDFRRLMGRFATGVSVVAVRDLAGAVHGMTANAFTSVSLNPPLVLVSVDHRARSHDLIAAAGRFGIAFLRQDQQAVSGHFAGKPDVLAESSISWEWIDGCPILRPNIGHMACTLWNSYPGGDHTLFVGEIVSLATADGDPLLFFNSRYHSIGGPC